MTEKIDRPRRGGEDVVTWAVETGRIAAAAADKTRSDIAMCRHSEAALEAMASPYPAPKPATQPPAKPPAPARPAAPPAATPPAAAARPAPVRAASEDPAAVLLRDMPSTYQEAMAAGPPPQLFPGGAGGGTLPNVTASGLAPAELASVPWWCRPAIAEAPTLDQARFLLAGARDDPEAANVGHEFTGATGYVDFRSLVQEWAMAGAAAADQNRQVAQARQARAVAAATHKPVTELTDDELYAAAFGEGDRHRAAVRARPRTGDRVGGPWHG
ncbi:hypothetical protein [Actinomadura opuntiae]|uniref:hypothetical protein n=1 Tax=Actinomadura sp. OS1-43 TaxID=604315 RepID=UPI00255AF373|nr:hypothetical protein [Actinomadura sp. OS1-43]MDL4814970.1 hypothetical protein [Actinomadura sp. OS1-43]